MYEVNLRIYQWYSYEPRGHGLSVFGEHAKVQLLKPSDLNLSSYCHKYLSDFFIIFLVTFACVSNQCLFLNDGLGQTHFSGIFLMLSGSDTGIGHALAKYLDNLGFVVFAGVLNKDGPGAEALRQTCSQRLSLLQLDVTNATQVKEAYLEVSEKVQNTGTASFHYISIILGVLM